MFLIFSAALLAAAPSPDPFARARADISAYCRSTGGGARCIQQQKKELGYFTTMMVGFKLSRAELVACMNKGKRGRFVDWTVATPCVRLKVKGRSLGS